MSPSEGPRIELARPEDAARLRALASELLPGPGAPAGLVWVARADGDVIGYLEARLAAHELHVLALAVVSAWRRRGVGRRLVAHAVAAAEDAGARAAHLELRVSNAAAQALYARLGFAVVGRRPRYYADGEDALLLTRPLRDAAASAAPR